MDACTTLKTWPTGTDTDLRLDRENTGLLVLRQIHEGKLEDEIILDGDLAEALGRALIDYSVQP